MSLNDLEELKRARKELDKKIQDIENRHTVIEGRVKFEGIDYWHSPSLWCVSIECDGVSPFAEQRKKQWRKICVKNKKDEVIDEIPKIIKNLNDLYERIKADGKNDE